MSREQYKGSYLQSIINEAIRTRCPAGRMLQKLMSNHSGPNQYRDEIIQNVENKNMSTERTAYKIINPELKVHPVYSTPGLNEHDRVAFSRMRLSSHHLKFETGRWSRIPPEERLCACGNIQSDVHVLLECQITSRARIKNGIPDSGNLAELFNNVPMENICKYCRSIVTNEYFHLLFTCLFVFCIWIFWPNKSHYYYYNN